MLKLRSRRTQPEERAVTIQKFRSSGLTQLAFRENEGVALSTFQNSWTARVRPRRAPGLQPYEFFAPSPRKSARP